jgi:phosphotransferase system HPr (HPr) family protein
VSETVTAAFIVASELGLHLRPAGLFVATTGRFDAKIEVSCGEEWVDGSSILSLVSLVASKGLEVKIRGNGPDAAAAVAALGEIIESEELPQVSSTF